MTPDLQCRRRIPPPSPPPSLPQSPTTPLSPLLPPLLPPETEKVSGNLTKVPDKPEGNLEATLTAAGVVALVVLAACCYLFVARMRLKKEDSCWGPNSGPAFVASASGYPGTNVFSKSNPPKAHVDVPLSGAVAPRRA